MMKIKEIDGKIKFLKDALLGGEILLRDVCMSNSETKKYKNGNIHLKSEIDILEQRKINIIRKQKIKKITNGKR